MSILKFWDMDREFFEDKRIDQIVNMCGNGKLLDNKETSFELRSFLDVVPSSFLKNYIYDCLNKTFIDSGLVLQDLIHQVGIRLGFDVEYGVYRGGCDGFWKIDETHTIVIEVKTTDAYRINLNNTVVKYRNELPNNNKSSILIISGREDTGELEEQIRGSKESHAIRLIGIDALLSLLELKEEISDEETFSKINQILKPYDYTRLDKFINIIYDTHKNAEEEFTEEENIVPTIINNVPSTRKQVQEKVIKFLSKDLKTNLIRKTKILFNDPKNDTTVFCSFSKKHLDQNFDFWFTYESSQEKKLMGSKNSYACLICEGDELEIYNIPYSEIKKLPTNGTKRHIHIRSSSKGKFIRIKNKNIDIKHFMLQIPNIN